MSRNEISDMIIEELDRYGLVGRVEDRSKHIAVVWNTPAGDERSIFLSKTPSDWRSGMNSRSQLRRMLRESGLQPKQDVPKSFARAMSLPKAPLLTPEAKESIFHKDFETLCDIILDLQNQVQTLIGQMQTAKIVSHLEFAKPDTAKSELESHSKQSPAHSAQSAISVPSDRWIPRIDSLPDKLLKAFLGTKIYETSELAIQVNANKKFVSSNLTKLKKAGYLENVRHGFWRRKL